ncbi:unnamed protein product [Symbiodinium sp. CCMP2456]|nr:unnamed protein product [Symbiodinium sp. CCMP2456]
MLVFVLGVFGALPLPMSLLVDVLGFQAPCAFAPWVFLTGTLAMPVFLLTFPYCSCASPKCFLDVVSIHQTDRALKMRGVYGLGGFLKVSEEMRVLWSPPYLTRLWCVFELAAFRKANPSKPLCLKPLFVESQVFLFMIGSGLSTGAYIAHQLDQGYGLGIVALTLAPLVLVVQTNRKFMREEKNLTVSLENFDLRNAECHLEADRVFVSMAIAAWYGSEEEFTDYVRGPLRKELLAAGGLDLPFSYALFTAISPFCMVLDIVVAMIRGGAPVDAVLAEFIGAGLGVTLLFMPVCCKIVWCLCNRWASPGSTRLYDYSVSLVVFVIFVLLVATSGVIIFRYVVTKSLLGAVAVCSVSCALAILAYGRYAWSMRVKGLGMTMGGTWKQVARATLGLAVAPAAVRTLSLAVAKGRSVHVVYSMGVPTLSNMIFEENLRKKADQAAWDSGDDTILASSVEKMCEVWRHAGVSVHKYHAHKIHHKELITCPYMMKVMSEVMEHGGGEESSEYEAEEDLDEHACSC